MQWADVIGKEMQGSKFYSEVYVKRSSPASEVKVLPTGEYNH
jgi:hypothetical protein